MQKVPSYLQGCCTETQSEAGRVGRCDYRAARGGCSTLGEAFVKLCPVACKQCKVCAGHPMEKLYADLWMRSSHNKLTASMARRKRAKCGAMQQMEILRQRRQWLLWAIEGNATHSSRFDCVGPTQRSCSVSDDKQRKNCMRRVCRGHSAVERLTPGATAASLIDRWNGTGLTNNVSQLALKAREEEASKLLQIGPFSFRGGDYGDFLAYNLLWRDTPRDYPGVYAEAGAFDGLEGSNTWFFERHLGWSGILIEPSICGKCLLKGNRPRSTVFHGAICGPPPKAADPGITIPQRRTGRTLDVTEMSYNFCAQVDPVSGNATWATSLKGSKGGTAIPGAGGACIARAGMRRLQVPCRSLTQIFDTHLAGKRIDFFSLDVETFDMEALRGLDFKSYNISSMLVECRTGKCRSHLREQGFATMLLTNYKDGMRGYMGDVLAWRPEEFRHLCAPESVVEQSQKGVHSIGPFSHQKRRPPPKALQMSMGMSNARRPRERGQYRPWTAMAKGQGRPNAQMTH